MEMQYRIKTTSSRAISGWQPMDSEAVWDYRAVAGSIEYLEVRPAQVFVPGYFQDTDDDDGEVRYFEYDPEDETSDWIRVNVTPAE